MKNYSSHIPTTGTDKFGTFIKYYKIQPTNSYTKYCELVGFLYL